MVTRDRSKSQHPHRYSAESQKAAEYAEELIAQTFVRIDRAKAIIRQYRESHIAPTIDPDSE